MSDWVSSNLDSLLTTVFLIVMITIFGYAVGRIRILNISLDLSGIFIVAIFWGILVSYFPVLKLSGTTVVLYDTTVKSNLDFLSSVGTVLFVSAISVSSGETLSYCCNSKKVQCVITGILMSTVPILIGFILLHNRSTETSTLLGIICGAMTSTPALSSVKDLPGIRLEDATAGYGIAYLFGVIGAVVFVQFLIPKNHDYNHLSSKNTTIRNCTNYAHTLFFFTGVMLIGMLIGSLHIPNTNITLGSSGGILLIGMLAGYAKEKDVIKVTITQEVLVLIRTLGLIFFFIGSGITGGLNFIHCIKLEYFVIGTIMTLSSMIAGYFFTKYFLKFSTVDSLSMICGGMTSTPSIGVLTNQVNGHLDLSLYGITYAISMFSLVLLTRAIYYLS